MYHFFACPIRNPFRPRTALRRCTSIVDIEIEKKKIVPTGHLLQEGSGNTTGNESEASVELVGGTSVFGWAGGGAGNASRDSAAGSNWGWRWAEGDDWGATGNDRGGSGGTWGGRVADGAWAVGDGESGWCGHSVGAGALAEGGGAWADGDIGWHNGGDPDDWSSASGGGRGSSWGSRGSTGRCDGL